jgi:hypothetical protein
VTAKKINEILAYCNITITDQELKSLINTPSFTLTNLVSFIFCFVHLHVNVQNKKYRPKAGLGNQIDPLSLS